MDHIKECSLHFLLVADLLLMQGCAAPTRKVAVLAVLQDEAHIPGFFAIRYWAWKNRNELAWEGLESVRREHAYLWSAAAGGYPWQKSPPGWE